MQKYTSANTSINKNKLPVIYKKISWEKIKEDWEHTHIGKPCVLDYGCGRYTDHIKKFLADLGFDYVGYDPNWANDPNWEKILPAAIICSNVLCVIAEDDIVREIIKKIQSYRQPYFITVYEGNGSGIGAISKKNCYQRNLKTAGYARFWNNEKGFSMKKLVITDRKYKDYIKQGVNMNETYERLKNYVEFIVTDQRILTYPLQFESLDYRDYFNSLCNFDEDDIEIITDMIYYTPDENTKEKVFLNKELMDPELYGTIVNYICDYIHLGWEGMEDD